MSLRAQASAKINLYLHVLRHRADGYHDLESLVVFADIGDWLTLDISRPPQLAVTGPFAKECGAEDKNLVIKAARALGERKSGLKLGAFKLEKNLPVASGMGGGSADAAAALRLLARANNLPLDDRQLAQAARATGADVPVCLQSRTALMSGAGDEIRLAEFPSLPAVLVNPNIPLVTRDVFAKSRFEPRTHTPLSHEKNFKGALHFLRETHNDLSAAARELCPAIVTVERELAASGAKLVRLSGSGATVFGLFETLQEAKNASANLEKKYPGWWIKAVTLGRKNPSLSIT